MIYMIEIDYADPASEAEWNAWYDTYLRDLVTVPGIETAQRFRGITRAAKAHLAVYTLASLSVYGEPRYREIGGGGHASAAWRAHIRRRRNLYAGVDRVPEVTAGSVLLVTEDEPRSLGLADILFVPLEIVDMKALAAKEGSPLAGQVPFDGEPRRRYVAIAEEGAATRAGLTRSERLAVYRPSSPRLVAAKAAA